MQYSAGVIRLFRGFEARVKLLAKQVVAAHKWSAY